MAATPGAPPLVLVVDGRAVAPVEVAADRRARARGLLGRSGLTGALLLTGVSSVHTVGMRFVLDVALCSAELEVLELRTVGPGRLVLPRRGVRSVVEAEAGSFARWGLRLGSSLGVRAGPAPPGRP